MKDLNKIKGFIALSSLKGIGPAFVKKVVSTTLFSSGNLVEEIKTITATNNKVFDDDTIFNAVEEANEIVFQCKEEGIVIIPMTSNEYPTALKELKDPPPVIYCKGNIDLLYSNIVGVIGTREPNETAVKISERIGSYFASQDWVICNGLAEGVDNYSVKVNGSIVGKVIGVLAGGLSFNIKKTLLKKTAENAQLVIDNNGLLVSEVKPYTKEDTFTVVKSCRIQAGLSQGLIIVQSSLDGGSRFATKPFCELKRPIGIINPIASDYDLPSYAANREIIEKKLKGLAIFADIKEDKITSKELFIIKAKEDYGHFQRLMANNSNLIPPSIPTLF